MSDSEKVQENLLKVLKFNDPKDLVILKELLAGNVIEQAEIKKAESITMEDITLELGDIVFPNIVAESPEGAIIPVPYWELEEESDIVLVDIDNNIVAAKIGECKVIAHIAPGIKAECNVTVVAEVKEEEGGDEEVPVVPPVLTSITLMPVSLELEVGQVSGAIVAILVPDGAEGTVVWSSSDDLKATVSNGVVTAVAVGSANIIATVGAISQQCVVTVVEAVDVEPEANS